MADNSAIEWTDSTWNPVTGCTKITDGCENCYAARFAERFRGVPGHPFENGFDITLKPRKMEQADHHRYQILTKRSSLMRRYLRRRYADRAAPDHIWLGVSVEHAGARSRIDHLRQAPAAVRFLSVEPLIGPTGPLDLEGIHWVIVGGESGPGCRPMEADWVREVRDECVRQGVAFFFKQWGGIRPKSGGRTLDDRLWNEMPRAA